MLVLRATAAEVRSELETEEGPWRACGFSGLAVGYDGSLIELCFPPVV